MRILGIESTCDETAAAVVEDGTRVLSNVVATQFELHAKYRGVVPEIASRAHIENILPVIKQACAAAACGLAQLDAIAVAHRPGLIGSLLIGVTAAKTLAWSLSKPLVGVDHVHAHLYSVQLSQAGAQRKGSHGTPWELPPDLPAVGLVISGGHTSLYEVKSWLNVTRLGSTIDDAVGEAYDKVAAILGLGYPGGPIIDRLAVSGDPRAIRFPRTLLSRDSLDFSFSGLKTAVLYHVRGVPGKAQRTEPLTQTEINDIAAGFQQACVDVIMEKIRRAARMTNAKSIIIGGGVSANRGLRNALETFELPVHFPRLEFCTDNAAMSAGLAHVLLASGMTSNLDLDAVTSSAIR